MRRRKSSAAVAIKEGGGAGLPLLLSLSTCCASTAVESARVQRKPYFPKVSVSLSRIARLACRLHLVG